MKIFRHAALAAVCLIGTARAGENPDTFDLSRWIQPVPESARFSEPGYFVWCGSMARGDDGRCHLFYSRWPKHLGFDAWVSHSEIAHAVSEGPLGPYRPKDAALPVRGKQFWDGLCTHDPTVVRFGAKFYLYYMGNTAPESMGDHPSPEVMKVERWVHRNNQRIGVAVADDPDGPWTRLAEPIVAPTAGFVDALCCTDPTVTSRPGGGYVMVYKAVGDKSPLPFGGPVVHAVATSDTPTGPFRKRPQPIFTKEGVHFVAEDPFIWNDGTRCWGLLKDQGGHFTDRAGSRKSLVLFRSDDGIAWQLARHPFVTAPEVAWQHRGHAQLAQLERPQIWLERGRPAILFAAADDSEKRSDSFNVAIPLRPPD
jgi:hypothetical protein